MAFGSTVRELLMGNTVNSVEVFIDGNGEKQYRGVVLKKSSESIDTIVKTDVFVKLEDILQQLDKTAPVLLSINGKGIINRKLENVDNADEEELLDKVLPNADHRDFFCQAYKENTRTFLSVARTSLLEEAITGFSENGYFVIAVYVGPFHITRTLVLTGMTAENAELEVDNYRFRIVEGELADYELINRDAANNNLNIGGEVLKEYLVTAFSAGFNHFTGFVANTLESVDIHRKEQFNRSLFRIGGIAVLSILVLGVLINTLFSYHFQQRLDNLQAKLSENKEQIVKIAQLKQDLNHKRELLFYLGLIENSQNSFYADRISSTVPSQIALTRMEFNPQIRNKDSFDNKLVFNEGVIEIEGTTPYSSLLNKWIKELNGFGWVDNISIMDYVQKQEEEWGTFYLKITIKD